MDYADYNNVHFVFYWSYDTINPEAQTFVSIGCTDGRLQNNILGSKGRVIRVT